MTVMSNIGIAVDVAALDALMPMHLIVGSDYRISHVGPTMRLLRSDAAWIGEDFRKVFSVRRPRGFRIAAKERPEIQRVTLHVTLKGAGTPLKGVLAYLPDENGVLINFGFGIGVVDAVRAYDLSASDFAPTDLTVEMLYLVEAKSAAMEQSRDLNRRLQLAKRNAELQAQTDPLTGARNRRALDAELDRLVSEGLPFGLMVVDLDFFKTINDTMGHAAGDYVLKTVAQILTEEIRGTDTIARVGGDEFVLILPEMTTKDAIDALAQRIIMRVQQPIDFDGKTCGVAASIGSTRTTLYDEPTKDQVSRDADAALYHSKRLGRGRHTCASTAPDASAERRATDETD